jgi:hypothetical protein
VSRTYPRCRVASRQRLGPAERTQDRQLRRDHRIDVVRQRRDATDRGEHTLAEQAEEPRDETAPRSSERALDPGRMQQPIDGRPRRRKRFRRFAHRAFDQTTPVNLGALFNVHAAFGSASEVDCSTTRNSLDPLRVRSDRPNARGQETVIIRVHPGRVLSTQSSASSPFRSTRPYCSARACDPCIA